MLFSTGTALAWAPSTENFLTTYREMLHSYGAGISDMGSQHSSSAPSTFPTAKADPAQGHSLLSTSAPVLGAEASLSARACGTR